MTLAALRSDELDSIANALEAGFLSVPVTALALGRYVRSSANEVAQELAALAGEDQERMVGLLRLVSSVRKQAELPTSIELVCTGPESAGVPIRDTRVVVRDLFARADQCVVVVGYALYQGRDVFRTLADRMNERPDVAVEMYLDVQRARGDQSSSGELVGRFARRFRDEQWPGDRLPVVYYDPRSLDLELPVRASLHAKCVVVDDASAFISSANFTEAAQVRNIEVGLLVEDAAIAQRLAGHFRALRESGQLQRVPGL